MYIFQVHGMTCQNCASAVKTALMAVAGVRLVEIDMPSKTVRVQADGVDDAHLITAIEDAGFDVSP